MKILHVFTLFRTATSFFDGQFKYLVDNGYEIHLVTSFAEDKTNFINRNKIYYTPIEISRVISPIQDMVAIWRLCQYIKKNKFDAVIGHTPKGALIAMIASLIMCIHQRIYYRHGLIYTTATGAKRIMLKAEEQFVSMISTNIINVSPSLSKLAIEDRLNSDLKQIVIGAGTCGGIDAINKFNPSRIEKDKFQKIKSKLGINDIDIVFGFCGRLCRDKGIIELIEAFNILKKKNTNNNFKLLLLGPYDTRDILPIKTKEGINQNKDIILVGPINEDIEYYYYLMDVFVFPSYREGFGMSVIEASAMEKPILVSKSHGCIDSIKVNETGKYINLTPRSIYDGMQSLLDKDERLKLGEKGREFVLENYDYSVMWPKILDIYKSILK